MQKYDFVVVGAGMFGAAFARCVTDKGKRVLVIEKRSHIGGNCYTENAMGSSSTNMDLMSFTLTVTKFGNL